MWVKARNIFLAGLVVLLPVAFTFTALRILFNFADGILGPVIADLFLGGVRVPGLGLFLTLAIIFFTGLLTTNLLGKRVIVLAEGLLSRTPLVNRIYLTMKQIVEAFTQQRSAFKEVVMVEYPRKGIYSLGFVTGVTRGLPVVGEGELVNVFIATTPNPTSGFILLLPRKEVIPLDISVEDGLKLIISAGVLVPNGLRLGEGHRAPAEEDNDRP